MTTSRQSNHYWLVIEISSSHVLRARTHDVAPSFATVYSNDKFPEPKKRHTFYAEYKFEHKVVLFSLSLGLDWKNVGEISADTY
jgi:hypothetical protein